MKFLFHVLTEQSTLKFLKHISVIMIADYDSIEGKIKYSDFNCQSMPAKSIGNFSSTVAQYSAPHFNKRVD